MGQNGIRYATENFDKNSQLLMLEKFLLKQLGLNEMNSGLPKQVCIIGAGYVGMSYAVLISSFADIKIWDIDSKKRSHQC